jgi:hypothetical protein
MATIAGPLDSVIPGLLFTETLIRLDIPQKAFTGSWCLFDQGDMPIMLQNLKLITTAQTSPVTQGFGKRDLALGTEPCHGFFLKTWMAMHDKFTIP